MENREAIEILRGCVVSEERENGKPNGNITCDLTREVLNMAIAALEKQEEKKTIIVETNIYDTEEIHHNCTVQVLRNSVTGEVSVGWWEEKEE